ncbi:MAG: translation initiation factor IF-2 N-terminal domain-containing protein, partial [Pseudomonadota bacterium]|nr:translation initiation factor IF-2 N-terminal domain-containing protein [Pseudomonadota bacterium]
MAEVSVKALATTVGTTSEKLLSQLKAAGIHIADENASVSDQQKQILLEFLKTARGTDDEKSSTKITLKRKSVSELKVERKTVRVEVRKKRTYVKPSEAEKERLAEEARLREEETRRKLEAEAKALADKIERERLAKIKQEESPQTEETLEPPVEAAEVVKAEPVFGAANVTEEGESLSRKARKKADKKRARQSPHPERKELQLSASRRKGKRVRSYAATGLEQSFERPTAPLTHEVFIPETITVANLAQKMSVKAAEVIKVMMKLGALA